MRWPLVRLPRLRWLLLVAVVVALAVLLPAFLGAPSGPAINGLVVKLPPGSPVSAGRIRAAAAPAIRGGLLEVNLAAVRARVVALPWVKQAEVRRLWPDALAIVVTPEHPLARWGEHALMDEAGRVFTPPSLDGFANLPRLAGPGDNAAALFEDFKDARARLAPLGLDVVALNENPRGGVAIRLAGATRVELGHRNPRAKLARFVTVAAPALGTALARVATVDMRYPNGFAVGWKRDGQHG